MGLDLCFMVVKLVWVYYSVCEFWFAIVLTKVCDSFDCICCFGFVEFGVVGVLCWHTVFMFEFWLLGHVPADFVGLCK